MLSPAGDGIAGSDTSVPLGPAEDTRHRLGIVLVGALATTPLGVSRPGRLRFASFR